MTREHQDLLSALQAWYSQQCNGKWEHAHGISIESLDNPGWLVKIDLAGTELHSRPFQQIADRVDAHHFPLGPRWLHCYVEEGTWNGAGDETKLSVILQTFLSWAAKSDS